MDPKIRDGIVLRTGSVNDASAAAILHAGQIGEGFLTVLGPKFLLRLYRRIALHPDSFLLIAESEGATVGFLAGSTDVGSLYRAFLWRDGAAAAIACGGRLLRSWRRVIETLRHGSGEAGAGAELLSVSVDPRARGRGAGTLLVAAFLKEVGRRDGDAAYVVVASANETAVGLYRRAGFHSVGAFELHPGTESLVMQWAATPASST